jgi:hypothetical protein
MGSSSAFGCQGGGTPLVPSWHGDDGAPPAAPDDAPPAPGQPPDDAPADGTPPNAPPAPPARPPVPPAADPTRFSAARNNFSRFAGSGGDDRRSLGRAISYYVGSSSGGARTAAARMGSARGAGSRLLDFLSDAVACGATEALRALNLDGLVGRPNQRNFSRARRLCVPRRRLDRRRHRPRSVHRDHRRPRRGRYHRPRWPHRRTDADRLRDLRDECDRGPAVQ